MVSMKTKFIWILIFITFLVLANVFFQENVRNSFYRLISPLETFFWQKGGVFSNLLSSFSQFGDLEKKNQALSEENHFLSQQLGEMVMLKEENAVLREALDLGLAEEFELILTEVVARGIREEKIIIIGGNNQGVEEDMVLITEEKVVVGKVVEVYENFSQARLISSPLLSFDVTVIGGERRISALAEGDANLKVKLKFLPKEEKIEIGDKVFTSSLANIFPKGFLVGEVTEVREDNLSSLQEVIVEPAFKRSLFKHLFLIENFKPVKESCL
jgi:rod shape-determining protein MreC